MRFEYLPGVSQTLEIFLFAGSYCFKMAENRGKSLINISANVVCRHNLYKVPKFTPYEIRPHRIHFRVKRCTVGVKCFNQ